MIGNRFGRDKLCRPTVRRAEAQNPHLMRGQRNLHLIAILIHPALRSGGVGQHLRAAHIRRALFHTDQPVKRDLVFLLEIRRVAQRNNPLCAIPR